MVVAARTAATADEKVMRNPSPNDFRIRPPNARTWSCTIVACNPRMSSAAWSPRARRSAVEPTTSVIMIVSSWAERLPSDTRAPPCYLPSSGPCSDYVAKAGARCLPCCRQSREVDHGLSEPTVGFRIRAIEILIDDVFEDRLVRIGMPEQ